MDISDTVNCDITYGNIDANGDNHELLSGVDNIILAGGSIAVPVSVTDAGSSNCINGGDGFFAPPCEVPADTEVVFSSSYQLQPGDTDGLSFILDNALFTYRDTCSDPETVNCNIESVLPVAPGASTTVVDACSNPPVGCEDSDACTADSCDPATGCVNAP
ncbi:MAG: hypothetical protein V7696_05915, partial [Halioglobus sp.]